MKKLFATAMLLVPAGTALADEATDARIAALEQRLAGLEAAPAAGATDNVKVNGFMSAGAGMADIDGYAYDGGRLSDEWTFAPGTLVGVQLDARVNDEVRGVVQLVGRGNDDFDINAEWAYIGWSVDDRNELRAGRQRYPFFMLSEYLEVGYAMPWVKPPLEMYQTDMPSSFEGLSWKHTLNSGAWTHEAQAFTGSTEFTISSGTFEIQNGFGGGVQSSTGNWLFSATFTYGDTSLSNPLLDTLALASGRQPLADDPGWFGGVGLQYDNGSLLVLSEYTQIGVEGIFPDSESAYLTLGWRFGKLMPHLTYSLIRGLDNEERPSNPLLPTLCAGPGTLCLDPAGTVPVPPDAAARLLGTDEDSVTAGLRYDLLPNTALKAEWQRVLDTHGSFGYFSREDQNVFYGALPPEGVDIFRVAVDVVF